MLLADERDAIGQRAARVIGAVHRAALSSDPYWPSVSTSVLAACTIATSVRPHDFGSDGSSARAFRLSRHATTRLAAAMTGDGDPGSAPLHRENRSVI
jgi:hypothetical protein